MFRGAHVRPLIAVVLIPYLIANPTILAGQQASTDTATMTIRANTRLVMVDVVVTDKKGQPVPGLKADDFTIEENGKKQKVSVFVPPGTPAGPPPTPVP